MKIVNKKKFFRSLLILIFIVAITTICINSIFNKPKYNLSEHTYIVSKDETLWEIAERYKYPSQDIRDYIYKIKELNNMKSASISEGQELTIIIYEECK